MTLSILVGGFASISAGAHFYASPRLFMLLLELDADAFGWPGRLLILEVVT